MKIMAFLLLLFSASAFAQHDRGLNVLFADSSRISDTARIAGAAAVSLDSTWHLITAKYAHLDTVYGDSAHFSILATKWAKIDTVTGKIVFKDTVIFLTVAMHDSADVYKNGSKYVSTTDTILVYDSSGVFVVKNMAGTKVRHKFNGNIEGDSLKASRYKDAAGKDTMNTGTLKAAASIVDTSYRNYTAPRSGTTVKSTAAIDSMTKAVADSFVGDGTKIKNTRMSPRYISFVAGGVWPTAALSFVTTSDTGGLGTSYVLKNADSTSVDSFVTSVIKLPDSLNTADSVRFCFNFYKPSAQADTSHWHIYSAICSTGSAKWTAQVVDSFNYINTGSIWLSNYAKQAYTYAVLGWKQGEHVQLKFSVYNNRVLYLKSVDVTLPQR